LCPATDEVQTTDPLRVHQVKVDSSAKTSISSHCDLPGIVEPVRFRCLFSFRQLVICCSAASAYNGAPDKFRMTKAHWVSRSMQFQDLSFSKSFLLFACCLFLRRFFSLALQIGSPPLGFLFCCLFTLLDDWRFLPRWFTHWRRRRRL
jgi:hypothetical protein